MDEDQFPMIDPAPEPEKQPFDEAARQLVLDLNEALEELETLSHGLPEAAFTEEEWAIIERTVKDVEESAERADEGYVAAAFDSHAWYRIMENQERILQRVRSAAGVLRQARERHVQGKSKK